MSEYDKDKSDDMFFFNAFDVLRETNDDADELRGPNKCNPSDVPHVEHSNMECEGPEQEGPPSCSPRSCQRIQTGLLSMPMQGERFTWHNCSLDGRSLWKRLDRLLVNDVWMDRWPNLFYTCLTPRTSDHSPLVLKGDCRNMQVSLFRFDNYLALSPGFLASVQSIWQHPVIGTPMYSVTRKLKALKSVFETKT
ncbi:UNVERIFIED_CONTAM: hypothetical protein Sangu_3198300 [Sesamum angustifolium]|uniref:Uncharacterized protein n=1 Tax=Sesamum angustifolium TaxID=2727405 RepID=A0AAW2JP69_9LAMI